MALNNGENLLMGRCNIVYEGEIPGLTKIKMKVRFDGYGLTYIIFSKREAHEVAFHSQLHASVLYYFY